MADLTASTPLPATRTHVRVPRWASLGILFGFLSATAIALYGPIGVSGTYPRFIGSILRRLTPAYASANPYLVKMGSLITSETMLVVGLLIGGIVSAFVWRTHAPAIETPHPGETSTRRRYRDAFIGGALIVFGARVAGGCTSGHIISGITQLAISGFLFAAAVFGAGIVTARLLKGGH